MAIEVRITRKDVVADVLGQLAESPSNLMIRYERPYTICLARAVLDGEEYMGMGIAKICFPDKWDKERGKQTVTMRAVRQIASEYLKKLHEDAAEANEVATDLGLTIMKLAAVSESGNELVDFIQKLEIEHELSLAAKTLFSDEEK